MSSTTVNVSFPKALLRTMDRVARQELRSRSELLREAARVYVERKRRWARLFAIWQGAAQRAGVTPEDVEAAIAEVRSHRRAS